jgi:hypothetical protein
MMAISDKICACIIGLTKGGNTKLHIANIIGVSIRTISEGSENI